MKCFKPCDVFISHAFEDKVDVADELHQYLEKIGVRTWYSGAELIIGENIHTAIDKGLRKCRHGLVILSPNYIGSWPEYELYRLLTTHKTVLPIWYKLSKEDIHILYPSLISIYAISIEQGIPHAALQVKRKVKNLHPICATISLLVWLMDKYRKRTQVVSLIVIFAIASSLVYKYIDYLYPDEEEIETGIAEREIKLADLITQNIKGDTSWISYQKLQSLTKSYVTLPEYKPNIKFTNGNKPICTIMGLKELNLDFDLDAIHKKYGSNYSIYLLTDLANTELDLHYILLNKNSTQYSLGKGVFLNKWEYQCMVEYSNFLRAIFIHRHKNPSGITTKIIYIGYKPQERLILKKEGDQWKYAGF